MPNATATPAPPPTITLASSGTIVLAKSYHGELMAVTYTNRAQAAKKAEQLGPPWYVFRGMGRPFYVACGNIHSTIKSP